jgi:catechol 2,3-dioxygenase-like lactoylglutathione lyase family enzyme
LRQFFLPANNLEAAKKYYKDFLGFPVKFDFSAQDMVAFKVANQEPAIYFVIPASLA